MVVTYNGILWLRVGEWMRAFHNCDACFLKWIEAIAFQPIHLATWSFFLRLFRLFFLERAAFYSTNFCMIITKKRCQFQLFIAFILNSIMIPWNQQKERASRKKEIEKALRASSNWKKHNQAQKTKSSCHQRLQQTNSFINVVIMEKVHVSQKTNTRNHYWKKSFIFFLLCNDLFFFIYSAMSSHRVPAQGQSIWNDGKVKINGENLLFHFSLKKDKSRTFLLVLCSTRNLALFLRRKTTNNSRNAIHTHFYSLKLYMVSQSFRKSTPPR